MGRMSSKSLAALGIACVVGAGCASVTAPFRDADPRWADYKGWTKVSDTPSTGPSPGLGAVHEGPEGIRVVYVNDVGADVALGDGPYEYPEGTVFVKEQYPDQAAFDADDGGLTVSVKVVDQAGAGAANWQWATGYKAPAEDNAFCSGCHSIPFAEDYVFSNATYLAEIEAKR